MQRETIGVGQDSKKVQLNIFFVIMSNKKRKHKLGCLKLLKKKQLKQKLRKSFEKLLNKKTTEKTKT